MILIAGRLEDAHTKLVADELTRRNALFAVFDTGTFLTQCKFSIRQIGSQWSGVIRTPDATIDIEKIRTIWYRRIRGMDFPAGLQPTDQALAYGEGAQILDSLWRSLEDRFWVSPPGATERSQSKTYVSAIAGQVGFDVPDTLLTNDPAELKPFYDTHGGEIVYKTLSQHTREGPGPRQGILTTKIREQDLGRAASIARAPCCFQRLIPKRVEYRVMAIGSKLFACEIQSQGSDKAKVDCRADIENLPHHHVTLPKDVETKCHEVMKRLGLPFGCIDLIETPEGRFHFLEVNPQGNWYWVEQKTGAPLLSTFVDLLISGRA